MILAQKSEIPKLLSFIVILGLIFGQQIIMVGPLAFGVSTTPASITFRATILLVATFLSARVFLFPRHIRWHKGTVFLLLFLSTYTLRFIYDLYIVDIQLSPRLGGVSKLTQFYFGSTVIPVLGLSIINFETSKIQKWIFYLSLAQCLAITYIFFALYGANMDAFVSRYYVSSIFKESDIGQPINPIIISRAGGMLAVCALFVRNIKGGLRIVCFGIGMMLLLLGSSRGPMLAFLFCALFGGYKYLMSGSFEIVLLKLVGLLAIVFMLVLVGGSVFDDVNLGAVNRMMTLAESGGKGEARFATWTAAWEQFRLSPLIGDRVVENYSFSYPHNLFLEVLMAVGLFGFIPFILTVIIAVKKSYLLYNRQSKLVAMLFFYSFIAMLFSGSIFFSAEFWIAILLVFNVNNYS